MFGSRNIYPIKHPILYERKRDKMFIVQLRKLFGHTVRLLNTFTPIPYQGGVYGDEIAELINRNDV